jgi:hypothetical protein
MATNDVFLRQDGGDGTNGVRLRIDAADSGGIISVSSATTDGADVSAILLNIIVATSSATTDGADVSAATIGPIAAVTSATTDGDDVSAIAISPVVGASTETTDGADVSAADVNPQSDIVSASSDTTNGADESAADIQVVSIIIGGHSGKKPKEQKWKKEKEAKDERRRVLAAACEDLPPEVKPVAVKAITGIEAQTIAWEPIIADLDRFQAAIMQMAIAKAARQDEEDIEELIEMGVI